MSFFQILQPLVPMLSAVLVAVLVDVALRFLVPPARDRFDPLFGIPARMAARLEAKLNRLERTRSVRQTRGLIAFGLIIVIGLALAVGLAALARSHEIIAPVIWFACFRITFPWSAGNEILKAYKESEKNAAAKGLAVLERHRITALVPTKNPDKHAILRMLVEAGATSLHRGLFTAVFWAGVAVYFGVSAIFAAVLVTTLLEAERIIVTTENTNTPFAKSFQWLEIILNFVPARIAAVLWVLGAVFTPNANPSSALRCMFNQSEKHRAVNSGWPVAAVAGALKIALPGGVLRDGWISPEGSTAQVSPGDLQRALWLHGVTLGLVVLIFTVIIFLGLGS